MSKEEREKKENQWFLDNERKLLDEARKEQFLMHYPHGPHRSNYWTSWRDGDWKVIYHNFPDKQSDNSHYQLYNLAKDPFEQTNLAEGNAKKLKQMMRSLARQLKQHKAVYPIDKEGTPLEPKMP